MKEIENKIFCDVQVIYDSITQLVVHTFKNARKVGPGIIEKFSRKGMFSKRDLFRAMETSSNESNHLPLDKLVKLLEHLKILTVISSSTYFMPCILKNATADQLKAALEEIEATNKNPAPLMIHYDYGFVPVGIFSHMIADITSYWILNEDEIWKNMVNFFVKDNQVILVSRPTYIAVALSRNPQSSASNEQVCPAILKEIKSSLKRVTSLLNYKSDVQYKFGFKCKHDSSPVKDHLCLGEGSDNFMRCKFDKKYVVYLKGPQMAWFSKV